jgi:hypothetical protein
MPIFDSHIHADTRGFEDLRTMTLFGTAAVVTCAHDVMDFSQAASVLDHFHRLLNFDCRRLRNNLIRPFVALGVHPEGIPQEGIEEVLARLPQLLAEPDVVAVGEIGLDTGSDREMEVLRRQLEIGKELNKPCIVHTPGRNKVEIGRLAMQVIQETGISRDQVIIDHLDDRLIEEVRAFGSWLGLSIQPSKLSEKEAARLVQAYGSERVLLNSDIAGGISDVLSLPKVIFEMRMLGVGQGDIEKVTYSNAVAFYRVEGAMREGPG